MLDFQCMFGHWDCSYSWHLASCTVWAACCNVSQDLGKRCQSKFALQLNEIPAYAAWFMKSFGEKLWEYLFQHHSFELRKSLLSRIHTPSWIHPKLTAKPKCQGVAGWHPWEAPGVCLGFRLSWDPWAFWWLYGSFAIAQQYISLPPPPKKKIKNIFPVVWTNNQATCFNS